MRFHHVFATILVLMVIAAYAALLADQITLIHMQRAIDFSVQRISP